MAVLGTHAKDTPIGGYSDVPGHVVSVLQGIQDASRGRFAVDYSEGVRITQGHCWSCDQVTLTPASVNRKLIAAAVAAEQVFDLLDRGVTDFHFYTMNRADLVYAVCHLLGLRPEVKEPACV